MIISRLFLSIQAEAVRCEIRASLSDRKVNKNGRYVKKLSIVCTVYLYFTGTAMQQIEQNAFGSFV